MTANGTPAAPPRLDVARVLRRSAAAIASDFLSVAGAGIALVVVPSLAVQLLAPASGDWGTVVTTLRAVAAMLYVALLSWAVVAGRRGRRMPPRLFWREGLARATPGVQVALIVGAAVVAGLTLHLFARHGTVEGWLLDVLLLSAGLLGVCVLMPLVPVAVVERLRPMAAFRRAAALTEGNRNRLLGLALIVALALAPVGAVVAGVAGPVAPLLAAGLEICALGLLGTVPAVVYADLRGDHD